MLPVVAALGLSLTDFDIYAVADLGALRFVGLANYARLLEDPTFWPLIPNWNRVESAMPDFLGMLNKAVVEDNAA